MIGDEDQLERLGMPIILAFAGVIFLFLIIDCMRSVKRAARLEGDMKAGAEFY